MSEGLKTFSAQVSAGAYVSDLFYILGSVGVLVGMIALTMLDAGIVDRKNVVDTIVQKWVCGMIGALAFTGVGYGLWNWQIYQVFGRAHALTQAISDWSLFGPNLNTYAQHIDPAVLPAADTAQIFGAFFVLFAMLICMIMHGAGAERMKPVPAYVMSALIGGIITPVMAYLTYSSASRLTNAGLHDFVGAFVLYIFVGVWSLILAWRLGPRRHIHLAPGNFTLVALGGGLFLAAIALFVPACGYLIADRGYYGITMNESGLGVEFYGLSLALIAGGLAGSLLAYAKSNPLYVILGPIAGYISCSALIDLAAPWQAFAIAFFGPFVMAAGDGLMRRLGIDEPKIVPLALGPGLYSAVMAGIVGAGRAQGGYFGVTSGAYAFQHAHISVGTQLEGVVLMVAGSALVALLVILVLEKTLGLRVTPAQEDKGLDATYWSLFAANSPPLVNDPEMKVVGPDE